MAQASQDQAG